MTLLKCMQATIRHELSEATVSYEEKPRDQWLFDYPAQVGLPLWTQLNYDKVANLFSNIAFFPH